jgi:hypothetical protein
MPRLSVTALLERAVIKGLGIHTRPQFNMVEQLKVDEAAYLAYRDWLGAPIDPLERELPDGRYLVNVPEELRTRVDSIVVRSGCSFSDGLRAALAAAKMLGALLVFLLGACSAPLPADPAPPLPAAAAPPVDTLPWLLADTVTVYVP